MRDFSDFEIAALQQGQLNSRSEKTNACDAVLAPDVTVLQSNITVRCAFLRLIDESNYEQYKQQYSAEFPGYFAGDYAQFNEARRKYFEQESFNLEIFEAKYVLQTSVDAAKINAWLQCATNTGTGLFAYLNDVNASGATLKVSWVPPAGLGKLRNAKLLLDQGTFDANNFADAAEFEGTAEIIIRRSVVGGWIRGVLSGIAGDNGSYSTRFYLPPVPQPHMVQIDEVSPSSMQFETRFTVPRAPLPKDVSFTVVSSTTVRGEHFTQAARFIQQYVWIDGQLRYDSGEVTGFGVNEERTLHHQEVVSIPAGRQVEIRVRNNHKGAKIGATVLRWTGQFEVLK